MARRRLPDRLAALLLLGGAIAAMVGALWAASWLGEVLVAMTGAAWIRPAPAGLLVAAAAITVRWIMR